MTVQTQAQLLAQWAGLPVITTTAAGQNIIDTLFSQTNGVIVPAVKVASYTFVLTDAPLWVVMNVTTTANTLTVPPNSSVAFPVGQILSWATVGTGVTTITPGAGVTVNAPVSLVLPRFAQGVLWQWQANTWLCSS